MAYDSWLQAPSIDLTSSIGGTLTFSQVSDSSHSPSVITSSAESQSIVHFPSSAIIIPTISRLKSVPLGDGPYRDWLNQLVRSCGLQERVSFAGPVGDAWLPAYYAACDTVVLPSTSRLEAFGIVGLEGIASGKPLVLSDIPGVRDVITSEEGRLVEPLDPDALAAALQNIWDYPERARQMGVRGRERIEREFAWPRVAEKIEKVLEAAISA